MDLTNEQQGSRASYLVDRPRTLQSSRRSHGVVWRRPTVAERCLEDVDPNRKNPQANRYLLNSGKQPVLPLGILSTVTFGAHTVTAYDAGDACKA